MNKVSIMNTDKKEIYFDNAATTRVDDDAARLALEVMTDCYGNPSSVHEKGIEASHIIKNARRQLTSALGYEKNDGALIITSCGSEANNTAFFGVYERNAKRKNNIVISDSEHPSVEMCARELEKCGVEVRRIPTVGGTLDLDFARGAVDGKTMLVSCMLVNNETGAMYDVKALKKIRDQNAPEAVLHVDAVQGFLKLPFRLSSLGADLISISGHKLHAPKGIGALFIKKGVILPPYILGGGQESGMRSGTENCASIAAFGLAAEKAAKELDKRLELFSELNCAARENISKYCPEAVINSGIEGFAPHILNLSIPGIRSEIMLRYLSARGIYVSAGSACSSRHADNRVLSAFGLDEKRADSALRVSFSVYNTLEQTEILAKALHEGVCELF